MRIPISHYPLEQRPLQRHNRSRDRGQHNIHSYVDEEDPIHGTGGDSDDYPDSDDDDMRGQSQPIERILAEDGVSISHVGNVDGMGDFAAGLLGALGDEFMTTTLLRLGLHDYVPTFNEYQITQQALMHLEPSVVEFIIPDETDRNKFLEWLHKYQHKDDAASGSALGLVQVDNKNKNKVWEIALDRHRNHRINNHRRHRNKKVLMLRLDMDDMVMGMIMII